MLSNIAIPLAFTEQLQAASSSLTQREIWQFSFLFVVHSALKV